MTSAWQNQMVEADCCDQDIADAIYHWRVKHGTPEDVKKAGRRDYIARTILLARAKKKAGAAPAPPPVDAGPRPLTDLGNAERLARKHAQDFIYDTRAGHWRRWDGRRWTLDQADAAINRAAHSTARSI